MKIKKSKNWKNKINRNNLIHESSKKVCDFRRFRTIKSFGDSIFTGEKTISKADKKQKQFIRLYFKLLQ